MAEPTKLTQAQALFAVLAGTAQSRRERVYYRDLVLRSSLYSLLDKEDAIYTSQITNDSFRSDVAEIDNIFAVQLTVDFIELRNTQIKHEELDIIVSAQMTLDDLYLRTTQIKYIAPIEDALKSAQIKLDSIVLKKTLIKYVEQSQYQINTSQVILDSISLV